MLTSSSAHDLTHNTILMLYVYYICVCVVLLCVCVRVHVCVRYVCVCVRISYVYDILYTYDTLTCPSVPSRSQVSCPRSRSLDASEDESVPQHQFKRRACAERASASMHRLSTVNIRTVYVNAVRLTYTCRKQPRPLLQSLCLCTPHHFSLHTMQATHCHKCYSCCAAGK